VFATGGTYVVLGAIVVVSDGVVVGVFAVP